MRNQNKVSKSHTKNNPKSKYKSYIIALIVIFLLSAFSVTVYAAETDPIAVVNNLSDFIFGLVRAIGLIMLGFGVVQVGLSMKSQDPSQRSNGFLTVAGGVIIVFVKEILALITGA